MHGLPCKKEVNLGNVNIFWKCKGWRTPEDSWKDMEVADEEAFFVNVLEGEKEETEDLVSTKKREEEESVRLERPVWKKGGSRRKRTRGRQERADKEAAR
jgi:hypothetical protein